MLRPKILPKVLEQAISSGVRAAFLLNKEGALLASAVSDAPGSDQFQVPVIAAIFSNIWETYTQRPNLDFLLCECEKGRVCMTQVRCHSYVLLSPLMDLTILSFFECIFGIVGH